MDNLYLRLLELRAELESSAAAPEQGLSVLYAIRRELLHCYYALPLHQVQQCSHALQDQFYQARQHLQQLPALLENSTQHASTEYCVLVLEQVASCTGV